MDYSEQLRRLSIDDEQAAKAPGSHPSELAKTLCLVRIGALVAVSAAAASIHQEIDRAFSAGASAEDIVEVLETVMPIVGRPRVVKAAPKVALALDVDLDLLGDE
ncbi:hypothetical protein [Microbacterium sp. H1-D42]|uniref:hypothetical protein n=1 Tax=Microbacterium sp. H1-D42 TaxID=2925844 RepID=UPI001F534334|nr:hypothetical protein [Microbacterium sp. H1-D42]UNK70287.1 hypothetical protein MNR00_14120 [Microbacterium sp. H1-D42]